MSATDETPSQTAKSAEDRKAASALENLDAADTPSTAQNVDADAVSKAMKSLGGAKSASASGAAASHKNVKVDPADVALLVEELELNKAKATELLKSNEGDAVKAMRAFVAA